MNSRIMYRRTFLWLDDKRNPTVEPWTSFIVSHYPSGSFNYVNATKWVKNYKEFIEWIKEKEKGLPYHIFFDHDLADEHYAPEEVWDHPEKYEDWKKNANHTEKTGMDCAKWLVEYCMDNNLELPTYSSHSANPYGRENILSYLDSYKRSKS